MTGGRGSYQREMGHNDEVPARLQDNIITQARAERGEAPAEA
jgi:hypothetical protein